MVSTVRRRRATRRRQRAWDQRGRDRWTRRWPGTHLPSGLADMNAKPEPGHALVIGKDGGRADVPKMNAAGEWAYVRVVARVGDRKTGPRPKEKRFAAD